ncbi:hypothetical protein RF11_12923 [Thelohanellus kitauei]|uniref:MD-2-related lipid-recognition domain-containing protein n=1 Tax=Thelohanellus kitauei TaxID=669202 RepID=A0A0C2IX86_THEKT|nr:hypothetical protein RF11_12923 [Thelohanellus kitauei]
MRYILLTYFALLGYIKQSHGQLTVCDEDAGTFKIDTMILNVCDDKPTCNFESNKRVSGSASITPTVDSTSLFASATFLTRFGRRDVDIRRYMDEDLFELLLPWAAGVPKTMAWGFVTPLFRPSMDVTVIIRVKNENDEIICCLSAKGRLKGRLF